MPFFLLNGGAKKTAYISEEAGDTKLGPEMMSPVQIQEAAEAASGGNYDRKRTV